jgi:hypothetical protein
MYIGIQQEISNVQVNGNDNDHGKPTAERCCCQALFLSALSKAPNGIGPLTLPLPLT